MTKEEIIESWNGMPEFVNTQKNEYQLIKVRFRNADDVQEFAKLVDQNLTEKTKSIWFPKLEEHVDDKFRYIDEFMEE